MQKITFNSVEDYITSFSEEDQIVLQKIRKVIQEAAPEAEEVISYQIPTYKQNGFVVHFAVFKNHFSLFPGPAAISTFEDKLLGYETSKGTIKFSKDHPIPYALISEIVIFRAKKNQEKKSK